MKYTTQQHNDRAQALKRAAFKRLGLDTDPAARRAQPPSLPARQHVSQLQHPQPL